MSQTYRRRSDDDTLRDGERRRVPMTAMDGVQKEISVQRVINLTRKKLADDAAGTTIVDSFGRGGSALRRPGYRVSDVAITAALDEVRQARKIYEQELNDAWRTGNKPLDARSKPDDDGGVEDTAGTQEGAKARKRKAQFRNQRGQETGTEELEEEDSLHRAQQRRADATDRAYRDYEANLVAAHKSWK